MSCVASMFAFSIGVGIRVNLSSCPTFADLVVALGKTLQLARNHGHFPFSTIAEEVLLCDVFICIETIMSDTHLVVQYDILVQVGLVRGLPIKFSFLHHRDIVQITNPDSFYFPETAVGVEGHGLARFGSTCYLTPLSSKMDDTCYFEVILQSLTYVSLGEVGVSRESGIRQLAKYCLFRTKICAALMTFLTHPSSFIACHVTYHMQDYEYITSPCVTMNVACSMVPMQLLLWESYEGESVGGGFRYQPQTIRTELVEAFGSELCRLLVTIAEDPCRPLLEVASLIRPPFLSSSRMRSRKH